MSADLNLLAGLLAVKLDFASRDDLVAATRAWQADKTRPLADLLPLSPDRRLLLDALVAEQLKGKDVPQALAEMSSVDWVRDAFKEVQDPDIERTINFIPAPVDGTVQQVSASPTVRAQSPRAGSRFRIIRPHARGGLGEVYVAEDTELSREVALKEIQPQHSGNENTRGRFMLEAEVTGGLEHPNIVPVYGLGTYGDGRPYYAMRFIRGDSLKDAIERFYAPQSTETTAERNLEFRNLLKRFVDVCNAIAYAHSRGILHRDLKPGNIMLGKYGETLVVDWGLAKALSDGTPEPHDAESATPAERHLVPASGSYAETQAGSIVGTPAFMSPEQAAAKFEELGPAADVYSLGATLYVILTGQVPFTGGIAELLVNVAAGKFPSPRSVKPETPASLNAVVMKAMAKDPKDRYSTATELAQEIERYLADEPVQAIREPFRVRARRWARKHPGTVAGLAASLVVGMLGAGSGLVFVNAEKNRTEIARQAEQIQRTKAEDNERRAVASAEDARNRLLSLVKANEIMSSIFRNLNPLEIAKNELPLQAILVKNIDQAIQMLHGASIGNEIVVADMQHNLGLSLMGLGEAERAILVFERCRATRLSQLGPDHIDTLESAGSLASAYAMAGKTDLSMKLHDETLNLKKAKLGPRHPSVLISMNNLANGYLSAGKYDLALSLLKEVIEIKKTDLGPDDLSVLISMNNLADGYRMAGKIDLAIPVMEETLKLLKNKMGPDHPHTLAGMNNLAASYQAVGNFKSALVLLEETLTITRAKLGPDHPDTLNSMSNLATGYHQTRKYDLALPLMQETLKLQKGKLGPDHPNTLISMNNLANSYETANDLAMALPLYEEVLLIRSSKFGTDHPNTLTSMAALARNYSKLRRNADAKPLFLQMFVGLEKQGFQHQYAEPMIALGVKYFEETDHWSIAETWRRKWLVRVKSQAGSASAQYAAELTGLTMNLRNQAKWADAEPICRECLTLCRKLSPDAWRTFNMESLLGETLMGLKKFVEAEPLLVSGYDGMKSREQQIPSGTNRLREAAARLVDFYTTTNQPEKAAEWRAKLPREFAPMPRRK